MGQVIVIGGGLAGLSSAILLAQAGIVVTLIEKKNYPFHRVCGEYISNEVLPFLETLGADIAALKPARINQFQLSSPSGKMLKAQLSLGGFGVSRFVLDHYLYQLAQQQGVTFKLQTSVETVAFSDEKFTVTLSDGSVLQSEMVAGAFGKRSNLDRQLNRPFFAARSPYLAIKYHLKTDLPKNVIALHNFQDGYAGISAIENDRYCFCYLTTRQNLKMHKTVAKMEEKVLCRNPHLQKIFRESEFLYEQPEVINEISFAPKSAVVDHVLCAGDAAGLITPLCGNGMAMAFHSGKIMAEEIIAYFQHRSRSLLETNYTKAWQNQFDTRLRVGRAVQQLFGKKILSEIAVGALQKIPFAVQLIIKNTHGKPF
ncbi:NAD(P)/FAD-dependent oxidoreductase [Adhaeribacter terreus]|uniref:NAD(P)/FAD-dependent oxidoreductase n=1 Tax=Adhaeribacter terreus TaxID=529703 RepID=A0ABW0EC98_9BACT